MRRWKGSAGCSFFILCVGAFLTWMSYGLVYPIFAMMLFQSDPIFLASASDNMKGLCLGCLLAASPLAQFFASPALGILSDRFGRKSILQISFLAIVVGYWLSGWGVLEKSFLLLILGRIVTGIGAGNLSVTNSAVADLTNPSKKAKNFALIGMASGLGFTVGPFLGGKLSTFGFVTPFIFAGLLTLAIVFCFNLLFVETHAKLGSGTATFSSHFLHFMRTPFLPKFRVLFPAFFLFCFGWSFFWEFIPVTWIKVYGRDASQIGNFYAYGSAFYVLSSGLLIRPILKKFNLMAILITSLGVLGVSLLLLLHVPIGAYWAFIPIQQFLVALIFPVGTALVSNAATHQRQGEILGAFQAIQSFAYAILPFLGWAGLLVSFNTPFLIGGITVLLGSLVLIVWRNL